jgi:hypothetical protein
MKNKFMKWLESVTETMFTDLFQAKAIIGIFGALGVCCLIGAFWNPGQLLFAALCAVMVLCGIPEYKKK